MLSSFGVSRKIIAMSTVSGFFKDSDTKFGVFYPNNYIVGIFTSYEVARQAREALLSTGSADADILVLSGDEYLKMADEIRNESGLWSKLAAQLSRVAGTEELYLDDDLEHAKVGAAFLAVYCPTDEDSGRIRKTLEALSPISLRRYSSLAVERMV
jgi:hypothetical protein